MKRILLVTTALVAAAEPAQAGPVAAAVAWVGSTLAAGGIMAAVVQTVIGLGLSLLASALMPKPDMPGIDVNFTVEMADDAPLSFVVGDYATAGKRKYIGSWGKNTRFITEVIEYSALPQGLSGLWVNDERGEFLAGQRGSVSASASPQGVSAITNAASVPGGNLDVGQPLANMRDTVDTTDPRIWVKFVDGTQTGADPLLVWVFGADPDYPWTAAAVGLGKSYAIVTTQYDDDTLTSYPQYLFEPEPLALYDLRFDSTNGGSGAQRWGDPATWAPTRNPAVIAYNIIRGIYFGSEWVYGGKNLSAWRLPSAEWIAAANECDDPVSLAGGGTEPRYRCGAEIRVDVEPANALEEIGKAANMRFPEVGGRVKAIVGLPGTASLGVTDGDIIITEGQSFSPFYPVGETYNAISATHPEPGEKWASKDAPEYIDEDATAEDGGRYLPTSISYPAAPHARQVQRLMRAQMRDFRRMRRHQFFLPPDAYGLEPGVDVVSWTSERNGYVNKWFMVESVRKAPGMNVLVSLREVDPSDYDWSSDFEVPVVITVPKNVLPPAQDIDGFTAVPVIIEDEANNSRRAAILVSCDGDETGVTNIQIQGRVVGKGATIDTTRRYSAPHQWYLHNVLPATAYQVRARLISGILPKSVWSAWLDVTTFDVKFSWDDFEAAVRADVDDAMAQATAAGEAATEANAKADELRVDLDAAVLDLGGDIEAVEQLALDNLNVANAYTDTSVMAEAATRQTATDALATQIQTLTAVLNSENYIENPRFSDGFTGWSGQTGAATVVAQDDLSGDPIIASAPTVQFASLPAASGAARDLYQDFAVEWLETEVFQWRCYAACAEAGREAHAIIEWYDDLGALIGTAVQVTLTLVEDEWRVFSGQHTPPSGAVSVRFRLRVPANVSTIPVSFADVSFTKVDQSAIARITDLETVVANNEAAFTLHRDAAESRLDDAEAAITSEQATRATADSALSNRVTTVEADVGGLQSAVTTQSTAIADLEGNAQAGYLIRAQAGGAVSLIDLIAADGDGPPTSIIKLKADDVLISGSVGMEMLTLVDLSGNMVPDADMVSAGAWGIGSSGDWSLRSPQSFNWSLGESAGEVLYAGAPLTFSGKPGRNFSVLQGVQYTFGGIIRRLTVGLAHARISVAWLDNNGDLLLRDWIVIINTTGGYVKNERDLIAPTGARQARIDLHTYADNETSIGFSSVSCLRKRTGSTLLLPGSVTSDLVTAGTMRALLGQFASLDAANIRVGNGEIDTVKISNAAITRAKIGDAAVDTLKIANRSVTAPYFATRAAEQALESSSTWETIVSLSINPTIPNSDIMVIASWYAIAGTFTQYQGSSGSSDYDRTVSVRLLWGGSVIATWTNTGENTARTEMDALINVPTGARNLVLQGRGGTFGNPSYSQRTSAVRGVNLFALELKR